MQIVVENKQKINGDDESFVTRASCNFMKKNDCFYIYYKESEELSKGVSTVIRAEKDFVTVTRRGDFSCRMEYKAGKKTECIYKMPYGNQSINIETKKADVDLDENGGTISLAYTMDFGGEKSENSMTIRISNDD